MARKVWDGLGDLQCTIAYVQRSGVEKQTRRRSRFIQAPHSLSTLAKQVQLCSELAGKQFEHARPRG